MKKYFPLIILFSSVLLAEGPRFKHEDSVIQQEYENVYQRINTLNKAKQNQFIINVKDYGAKGDGVANDYPAIMAAYNQAVNIGGADILLPSGTYYIGINTIKIEKEWIRLIGEGMPYRAYSEVSGHGTTIYYVGTSTAIIFGIPNKKWTFGVGMENIRILSTTNTHCDLALFGIGYSNFKNIAIYGNAGANNYGIYIAGSIATYFEMIDIVGNSSDPSIASSTAAWLGYGLYIIPHFDPDSAWSPEIASQTNFNRLYVHYCYRGAYTVGTLGMNFDQSDFEANTIGFHFGVNSNNAITNSKFEANGTYDMYFDNPTSTLAARSHYFSNVFFNGYNRRTFIGGIQSSTVMLHLVFDNPIFSTDYNAPYIFDQYTVIQTTNVIEINNPVFEGAGGADFSITYGNPIGYNKIKLSNMNPVIYRFIQTDIQSGTAYYDVPFNGITTSTYAVMSERGNIIGVNIFYSSGPISDGYDITTSINGSGISQFSYPNISTHQTNNPNIIYGDYLKNKVKKNDALSVYFHTENTFAPIGGTIIYEVIVSYGDDGTYIY